MIKVVVSLKETSQYLQYEAENTYQKGDFFCILLASGKVLKYPVANIWRVEEEYGGRRE